MHRETLVIVTPALASANNGNWQTARRWQRMLTHHHKVRVVRHWPDTDAQDDDAMLALQLERARFDAEIRSKLGDSSYERYREWEREKPLRQELAAMYAFAEQQGTPIDPAHDSILRGALEDYNLTTTEAWDGPYDPLPSPVAGKEAVLTKVGREIEQLTNGLQALESTAPDDALPIELLPTLREYVSQRIQVLQRVKSVTLMSPEERQSRRERIRTSLNRALPTQP